MLCHNETALLRAACSTALACAACSLFPDTAPRVEADAGAGGSAGFSAGGGSGGGSSGGGGNSDGAAGCGPFSLALDAFRDTYIVKNPPAFNHGAEPILEVLTFTAIDGHRAMIAFDLGNTTLPAGAKLQKARLLMQVVLNDGVPQDLGAHRLERSWTEAGANWIKFDGAGNWTTNGGDFATPSAQVAVGPGTKVGDVLAWDVTPDVAGMLEGKLANEGWLVKPLVDEPLNGEKIQFASREAPDANGRPKLELTYVVCP